MPSFTGFTDRETFTPLPDSFFNQLLNEIDDLGELKVTLFALWRIEHMEGRARPLRRSDFSEIPGIGDLNEAIEKAIQRGSLIEVQADEKTFYFLNTPRGRAVIESIRSGGWHPDDEPASPPTIRPNIFKLYEENIGPLTPMIADTLRDAEKIHPAEWLEEAIEIAVKANKRNWRYIEAILTRWKEEGYAKKQAGRDTEKDRRRYIEGEFADFIEH